MKSLIWNCKSVRWKYPDKTKGRSKNCLLVYICCEQGDTTKQLKEILRRINQLNQKRYCVDEVVIFPFAHLSNQLLEVSKAEVLVSSLQDSLSQKVNTTLLRFNHDKEIYIHLLPTNRDVTYISY